jgi:hypothetical protein
MYHGLKHIFRGTETFVTILLMTKFREQNHLTNEAISLRAIEWVELKINFQERIMYWIYYWKYLN